MAGVPPRVPDHELVQRIGQGAYGEVWLARNIMGSWRAIKVVWRDRFTSERPYEREFAGIREFEPVSRLHPSQIDILHVGRDDEAGCFYYVMELADDQTAGREIVPERYSPRTLGSDLQRGGRLGEEDCLRLGVALCTALEHLHAQGLAHRDIKPGNIVFINGQPKLADLGLVAKTDEALSFVGTAGFVPPEGPGSAQADIFSLGRVLYEASTGLSGSDFPELPTRLAEGGDAALAQELNLVVLKACAPDPRRRYGSAAEMREELELLLAGRSVQKLRRAEKRAADFRRFGVAAAVIAVAAVGVTTLAVRSASHARAARQNAEKLELERRSNLIRTGVANALRRIEQGDLAGSLPWLVEAAALESDAAAREMHRLRLASLLERIPPIAHAFFHDGVVNRVSFSPDGRRLLSASQDGTAKVWSLEDPVAPVEMKQAGEVTWAAWDEAGARVVTSGADRMARVWDAATGEPLTPPLVHAGIVWRAVFSADGRRVASTGGDGRTKVWDAATGRLEFAIDTGGEGRAVAFSPDGSLVATAAFAYPGNVQVWDVAKAEKAVGPLDRPGAVSWVTDLKFSPDGRRLAFSSWARCAVFDATTGEELIRGWGHGEEVLSVDWSAHDPGGAYVVSASNDQTARLVHGATGQVIATLRHDQPVTRAVFSRDGTRIVTTSEDGTARVWSLDGSPRTPPLRHSGRVLTADFGAERRWAATAGYDGMVRVWDLAALEAMPPVVEHAGMVRDAVFTSEGARAFTADNSGKVHVWDTAAQAEACAPLVVGSRVARLVLSHDESRLLALAGRTAVLFDARTCRRELTLEAGGELLTAAITKDGQEIISLAAGDLLSHYLNQRIRIGAGPVTVQRWSAQTGKPVGTPLEIAAEAAIGALSADGRYAAVGFDGDSPAFQLWDVKERRAVREPTAVPANLWHIEFSPDGARVATASAQSPHSGGAGIAQIWDCASGLPVTAPLRHEHSIYHVAFSQDGTKVITASQDATARIWSAVTGEPLTGPLRHKWKVAHATFSGDGRLAVSASSDGSAHVWDVSTGDLVTPPLKHRSRVYNAWFSPCNRQMITSEGDGRAHLWSLPRHIPPDEELVRQATLLAAERRDPQFGVVPLARGELRQLWERR